MPVDVSDEALEKLCEDAADDILSELFAGQNHKSELVQLLLNLSRDIRDMTARADLRWLFPGSCETTEEKQDGG